jgi:hypothetical protein
MAKAKKCNLILHGTYKEHTGFQFESISAAKKYVRECWDRPYTINPIQMGS